MAGFKDTEGKYQLSSSPRKDGASATRWRCVSAVLALLCLGLVIALITVAVLLNRKSGEGTGYGSVSQPECGTDPDDIDTSENTEPGPRFTKRSLTNGFFYERFVKRGPGLFDDLTTSELKKIQEYLHSVQNLGLVRPSKAFGNTSYVYVSDLHPPSKYEALNYLNGKGPRPERNARVVIFRGDVSEPKSEEYIVGPLPNPNNHQLLNVEGFRNPVPYAFRPLGGVEFRSYFIKLFPEIDEKVGFILKESYGATFTNCVKCLYYYPQPISSGISRKKVRKMWFTISQKVEYYILNPVDFLIRANIDSPDPYKYFVEKIVYADQVFSSLDDLATQYRTGSIRKSKIPFPTDVKKLISSMHRRGDPVPKDKKRAPRMYEPDGKRYTVKHRHVEYMQWSFDFRMSTLRGPQLYDIKFNNERIAYEVGLQEIAVYYASNNSASRSTDYVDSGALIGTHSQSLVPGADCPETSTFFNYTYLGETSEEPIILQQAFCLFEQNQGVPLRRHLSYTAIKGGFYSGLEDITLVLRSILTIGNYDYVMDFIFHQSGALEVRAMSTGYISTSFYTPKEDPYGFQLKKNTIGNIHHHMFLFKAYLDLKGINNRYETLDISRDVVDNSLTTDDPNAKYYQIKYDRNLKTSEMEAAYTFNFDDPKYHVIHNNNNKTRHGAISAYRIHLNGMSKQLLPEDIGNEIDVAWARNQLTVTKYKDNERDASSIYGMFDSLEPTVNFTKYYADDDDIVDQDLVTWISIGVHHIPHTEDLPVTPTPGSHLGFILLPYNYFEECPSSQSRDSIRVEYKDPKDPKKGARVVRYNNPEMPHCLPITLDYDKMVEDNPTCALDTSG